MANLIRGRRDTLMFIQGNLSGVRNHLFYRCGRFIFPIIILVSLNPRYFDLLFTRNSAAVIDFSPQRSPQHVRFNVAQPTLSRTPVVEANYETVSAIADYVRAHISIAPEVGIICGSGLGKLADSVNNPVIIKYSDIPNFPQVTGMLFAHS